MRTRITTALLLSGALLLAACSAEDGFSQASGEVSGGDEMADAAVDDGGDAVDTDGAERALDGEGGDDVVTFGGTGSAVTGRALARTASVILEVEDVEQASAQVGAAAQRAGGFVSEANVRGGEFGYGVLTLRVPAASLDATIEDLADVGLRVVESSIATEDLTEQLTDVEARIANLTRLEEELQALLTDVRDGDPQANQLLQVFDRLNQVRGDIERLEAQRAAAQDRVSLATINVELVPTSTAPEPVEPEPETTLGQALEATGDAFGTIADGLIWLVVTILPVLLVVLGVPALLLWGLVRLLQRRKQARRAAAPQPAPPAPPPAREPVAVGAPTTPDVEGPGADEGGSEDAED